MYKILKSKGFYSKFIIIRTKFYVYLLYLFLQIQKSTHVNFKLPKRIGLKAHPQTEEIVYDLSESTVHPRNTKKPKKKLNLRSQQIKNLRRGKTLIRNINTASDVNMDQLNDRRKTGRATCDFGVNFSQVT